MGSNLIQRAYKRKSIKVIRGGVIKIMKSESDNQHQNVDYKNNFEAD